MLYVNFLWRSSFAFYFISSRANHVCLVLHFFPSSEWHFLEILFVFHLWHFRFQFHLYGDILKSFGYIFRYRRWPNEHSACKQIKNFSACVERVWFVINCSSNNCRIIRMWCRFSVGFQVYVSTPRLVYPCSQRKLYFHLIIYWHACEKEQKKMLLTLTIEQNIPAPASIPHKKYIYFVTVNELLLLMKSKWSPTVPDTVERNGKITKFSSTNNF